MVVGPVNPSEMNKAASLNLDILVSNFEQIEESAKHNNLNVHIKIDTGMSRQGFQLSDLKMLSDWINKQTLLLQGSPPILLT